jgi:hypothetical protein
MMQPVRYGAFAPNLLVRQQREVTLPHETRGTWYLHAGSSAWAGRTRPRPGRLQRARRCQRGHEIRLGKRGGPDERGLSVDDLTAHLKALGLEIKGQRERENLHLLDVTSGGKTVRLRVATLPTTREAGRDLHIALLEHGKGFWGVHRSNLAVLATPGPDEADEAFLKTSKLSCWGVYTTAGRDDTFVVPGGYFEF